MSRPLSNNQVSVISIPGQGYMTYNTYTWTMPSAITLPGGTKKENTYTPLMQLKSLTVKDPTHTALMNYDYGYSPTGNIAAKITEHGNYTYQYDELYRLINATNASNEAYTYDAVGNRLTSADVQGNWSYNDNNELLSYDAVSYEYDANGNITSKTDQIGTTTYIYDFESRLIQIRNPQSAIYNYYYDPFGKRLWKEVSGVRTHFFYSDEGLIGEYDANGNEIKTYGYAPNSTWTTNPLFQKIGINYYWYQNDHLGTPQKIVDASGRVVWSVTFDSFGKAQIQVSEIENNLRFPGQYYDQETGLHYNWNRYYDPKTGRYLTPDPIGLEGEDVNLYAYVHSNPVNFTDSLGLRDWGIGWGIGWEYHIYKGWGRDTFYCCDINGKKWRVRTTKRCKGYAAAITGGITFQPYVKGNDCPDGYAGQYAEIGGGPIEIGVPKDGWSGFSIGFGGGIGFKITTCEYTIEEKKIIGCCKL